MTFVLDTVRRLGKSQRQTYRLPIVAMEVAQAAKRGDIDVDDAIDLYIEYMREASGIKKWDPASNTIKANASKLRQIIKAADPDLLLRVERIHNTMRDKGELAPGANLYPAMVNACRLQVMYGKMLTDGRIRQLLQK